MFNTGRTRQRDRPNLAVGTAGALFAVNEWCQLRTRAHRDRATQVRAPVWRLTGQIGKSTMTAAS